ncbi:dermonecrotic toxin domain-containing protein [Pseudomonas silesiensis]
MNERPHDQVAAPHPTPTWQMRNDLKGIVDLALPQTPDQFGEHQIKQKWGQGIDPQTTLLVTLDYDYNGHPAQGGIHQGQVASSRSLLQALLFNEQTVGDGRWGETAFGLYTPPDIGPDVRLVAQVDEFAYQGIGNHQTYEGIYRQTVPQIYGPSTQIALRPADFKKWVWELDLQDRYKDYLDQAWPSDEVLMAAAPYALRTSVKAAFVMSAWLQLHEQRLTQKGLELALEAAGLPPDQTWESLTINPLQAPTPILSTVQASRLKLYRYTATDIWIFRRSSCPRVLMYIPGNSSPLHDFTDVGQLHQWVVAQGRVDEMKQALAAHFAEEDRADGTFHAGVLTALAGMAIYPGMHRLTREAGFFNNDGYWDPAEYIGFDDAPAGTDPFAQLVLTMKQAALASVKIIRDDAQVNRDNLSAVVEPVVQWVNRFGPLALFIPGGDGLLALAGLIDAGYGLDQAINGTTASQRSQGVTRTVFGLLNALPIVGIAGAAERDAIDVAPLKDHRASDPSAAPDSAPALEPSLTTPILPVPTRLDLLRGIGPSVATFSDEILARIGKVCAVDDDMLRLMNTGRPPTPLLADTISRFRIDQDLESAGRPELFNSRYEALQQSEHEWVRMFQREYPGLPKSAIEQMLDRYGVDIRIPPDAGEAVHVFKRLDSKARQYQQHVWLNRAYEGLYLRSVRHPQADTLALHSLKNLPGWPANVCVEVRDQSAIGRVLDRTGPLDAPHVRRLVKTGDHYLHQDLQTDFYGAVLGVLTDDERSALQLMSPDPASELRLKIGDRALSRSEFMLGSARKDSGLPFERQGLRGGWFPDPPPPGALRHQLMRAQVRDLYPEYSDAEADEWLQRAGASAQAHLDGLQDQLQQLNTDLNSWIDQTTDDVEDMDLLFLDAADIEAQGLSEEEIEARNVTLLHDTIQVERDMRAELADEMIAIWQRRAPQEKSHYSGSYLNGFTMNMDFEDYHRLPGLNVRLDAVTELSMRGFHLFERETLNDFLENFPKLRTLNLENVDLRLHDDGGNLVSSIPPAMLELRHLTSLNLRSTEMAFTEPMASRLKELTQLQRLDLSDNPLVIPPLLLGMNDLRWLNLRNTRISKCPIIMVGQPYMDLLDLRHNQITRVPPPIMNQAITRERVLLQGNPLTDEDTLLRLVEHRQRTGINLWLSEPGPDYGSVNEWVRVADEADEAQRHARILIWLRLADKHFGERFLRIIDRLTLTADFRVDYLTLQARVWRLLGEADASEELWRRLAQSVEVTEVDADNPLAIFSVLEDRAKLYRDWVAMRRPFPLDAN